MTTSHLRAATAGIPAYAPVLIDVVIDGQVHRYRVASWHHSWHHVAGERPTALPIGLVLTAGELESIRAEGDPAPLPADFPKPKQPSQASVRASAGWKTRRGSAVLAEKGVRG